MSRNSSNYLYVIIFQWFEYYNNVFLGIIHLVFSGKYLMAAAETRSLLKILVGEGRGAPWLILAKSNHLTEKGEVRWSLPGRSLEERFLLRFLQSRDPMGDGSVS